jgi:lysine 2,3-aminomutase
MRSAELSRMARQADRHMKKYASGLERDAVRRRQGNKKRILKYFNATEQEWQKWQWHLRHIIQNADTLKALVNLTDRKSTRRFNWPTRKRFLLASHPTIFP